MTPVEGLFDKFFDDAAIFPPGNLPLTEAVEQHRRTCADGSRRFVRRFVCSLDRLAELRRARVGFPVAVTLPDARPGTLERCRIEMAGLNIRAVEVPLDSPSGIGRIQEFVGDRPIAVFAELSYPAIGSDALATLARAGFALKMRTGGLAAAAFPSERVVAGAIHTAVAAGVPFKMTAGLHNALRHRDAVTGFEHHGFVNVIAAVTAAQSGAGRTDLEAVLAQHDPEDVVAEISRLDATTVAAVRAAFISIGTCIVAEGVADLSTLGLIDDHLAPAPVAEVVR